MSYCTKCGTELKETAKFCHSCGQENLFKVETKDNTESIKKTDAETYNTDTTESPVIEEPENCEAIDTINTAEPHKFRHWLIVIIAGVLILLFAAEWIRTSYLSTSNNASNSKPPVSTRTKSTEESPSTETILSEEDEYSLAVQKMVGIWYDADNDMFIEFTKEQNAFFFVEGKKIIASFLTGEANESSINIELHFEEDYPFQGISNTNDIMWTVGNSVTINFKDDNHLTLAINIHPGYGFFMEKTTREYLDDKFINQNSTGNTIGNISNGGSAAISGEWIYYTSNNSTLCKIKTDGSQPKKLSDDNPYSINVIGDWIYYASYSDENKLYKIKTDGSNRQIISTNPVYSVNVVGNWIYYVLINSGVEGPVYKMKTDGSDQTLITNDYTSSIGVSDDWLFYILTESQTSQPGIYRIDLNGGNKTCIATGSLYDLNIVDDWIYCINRSKENQICKIKIDGSENYIFTHSAAQYINVTGDWIYYDSDFTSTTKGLYKMMTDGSQHTKLNDDWSWGINVVGDWIYYLDYRGRGDETNCKIKIDGTQKQTLE